LIPADLLGEKTQLLAHCVEQLLDAGKREGADRTLQEALKLSKDIPADEPGALLALEGLARAQAFLGEFTAARKTVARLRLLKLEPDERLLSVRAALSSIAEGHARAGDFRQAIKTAQSLDRTRVSIYYAITYGRITEAAASKKDIKVAMRCANLIPVSERQVMALVAIAQAQMNAGNHADAKAMRQKALEAAKATRQPAAKAMGLRLVSTAQAKAGDIEGALQTANAIKDIAELDSIGGDFGNRAMALAEIAAAQARTKDVPGARKTFDLALKAVEEQKVRQSVDYGAIALAQASVGDADRALAWSTKLVYPPRRAYAMLAVARGLLQHHTVTTTSRKK
jgi:tetratricopeptide (TPR) repeat protein